MSEVPLYPLNFQILSRWTEDQIYRNLLSKFKGLDHRYNL